MKILLICLAIYVSVLAKGEEPRNQRITQKSSVTQRLPDGSCVRKSLESVDGETSEVTENVDCEEVEKEQQQQVQQVQEDIDDMQEQIQQQLGDMLL